MANVTVLEIARAILASLGGQWDAVAQQVDAARQYVEIGDKAREAASIPPKKPIRKNEYGQYVIKYDAEVDGDKKGAWIVLTPNALLSRDGEYFCWLQVDLPEGETILMPLREHQIAVFETAFAEFMRNVAIAQQAKNQI